jgi:hypothetical protein
MAALADDVKGYIVRALACFDTPETVAKAVKAEFELDVTRQQVAAYDPNKVVGANLSEKWKMVFEETRKRFLEDASSIGVANRTVRLRRLERMADKAESIGAIGLAAQLLEQAAKESGGSYTNQRNINHSGGIEVGTKEQRDAAVSAATDADA